MKLQENTQAKALEPPKPKSTYKLKFMQGTNFQIAALNITGTNTVGVSDGVERWMKARYIRILALQESKVNQNIKESRDNAHGSLVEKEDAKNTLQVWQ